ncbi:MAG TPA: hypothetical protein PKE55_08975 [Kiritimatiellia bacterium]|mgnify:CR=1 FL=1|nr:hypothetical protein [Kiritimatiellia bacterium]
MPIKRKSYIRLQSWPPDHAAHAYKKGFYIEAMQVLHAFIEHEAKGFLLMVGCAHFKARFVKTRHTLDNLDYKHIIAALHAIGKLTSTEARDLLEINTMRNTLIHRTFSEPGKDFRLGVVKEEYDRAFRKAMKWA